MAMWTCNNVEAGTAVLACISQNTNYTIGYTFIILLAGILLWRFTQYPFKERIAVVSLLLAIVTFLGSIQNILFPDHFFTLSAILFIGSFAMLAIRST